MGLLTVQQSNKNVMCKHSDYIDNDAHFLPGPGSPMQECF